MRDGEKEKMERELDIKACNFSKNGDSLYVCLYVCMVYITMMINIFFLSGFSSE